VDLLSEKYYICPRHNGGANAGHTVVKNGKKYLLPCGVLSSKTVNLISNGTGVAYKINGKTVETFPSELEDKNEVVYETSPE
jgi:adenylosuccinate synthase